MSEIYCSSCGEDILDCCCNDGESEEYEGDGIEEEE